MAFVEHGYTDEEMSEILEFNRNVYDKIKKDAENALPVNQRVKFVSFKSYSSGKGRKRKEERIVELLVVDRQYAYVVDGSEVNPRITQDRIPLDILATEVLTHLPWQERTIDKLLEITMDKVKK